MTKYDPNNVFAKIIRNEIPHKVIYEDKNVLCFEDAYKKAPLHWLVIPKKPYVDFHDFTSHASEEEIAQFFKAINRIVSENQLEQQGFRLVANTGANSGQSVFHFHIHILSGKKMNHEIA